MILKKKKKKSHFKLFLWLLDFKGGYLFSWFLLLGNAHLLLLGDKPTLTELGRF